jgi:hypothetical protein
VNGKKHPAQSRAACFLQADIQPVLKKIRRNHRQGFGKNISGAKNARFSRNVVIPSCMRMVDVWGEGISEANASIADAGRVINEKI